ncbi:hypothetical protein BAUCODRAFT_187484 [Baudoinia panamericana UAMH 10762]|uniref:Uncharacterized protein n=1 Tax=Baudoinia panamericana (strain UAMH 10762) TaxID=717646 RepID=M2N9L0_BAUPA|nr:uncharacterized protein BAUCODRAFT_187484 [Baudoinia panamericana UAMH 10762]EMD00884.1 hypothetical protein BAUCODRAFT_187484 [Baudoinia panamericana UAMH 10762]
MAITNRHASPFDASASPQPQPASSANMTKRDVRRNRIMERLQAMIDSFSANQHQHYRAQLQAVQVDMTLVLRAEPYENGPLEDGGEEIRGMVEAMMASNTIGDEAAQRDYLAMAGTRYAEFAREVNDELAARDAELVALNNNYHNAVAELERLTQQKLHQADEEHKALSSTIRQRLITSITKKRQHLLRDKEQLDIADSNALLLHPNHFSINNPSSPGGGQNRKTRHLRHRAGSPNAGDLAENGKRKRKVMAMDDDGNESPAPAFRPLPPPDALGGGRSPFKDARRENAYTQFEAPAYSLERIFTDKELAMATATAQQATYKHFHGPKPQETSTTNGTAVPSYDGETLPDPTATVDGQDAGIHPTTELTGTPPPSHAPPAAPEMERQTSHQVLTRGARAANPLAALSDLANVAAAAGSAPIRDNPFAPVLPTYNAVARSEKSGAPAPPAVGQLDLDNDFEMMRQAGADAATEDEEYATPEEVNAAREMRRNLLDQALGWKFASQPYRLPLTETGPANVPRPVERPLYAGFSHIASLEVQQQRARQANAAAAVAAAAGMGSGGSLAMALQGKFGLGAEPMSRTTSAGGMSESGEVATGLSRRGRGKVAG